MIHQLIREAILDQVQFYPIFEVGFQSCQHEPEPLCCSHRLLNDLVTVTGKTGLVMLTKVISGVRAI